MVTPGAAQLLYKEVSADGHNGDSSSGKSLTLKEGKLTFQYPAKYLLKFKDARWARMV